MNNNNVDSHMNATKTHRHMVYLEWYRISLISFVICRFIIYTSINFNVSTNFNLMICHVEQRSHIIKLFYLHNYCYYNMFISLMKFIYFLQFFKLHNLKGEKIFPKNSTHFFIFQRFTYSVQDFDQCFERKEMLKVNCL